MGNGCSGSDSSAKNDEWWCHSIKYRVKKGKEKVAKVFTERRGWKTVRLFVSSTFSDMHAEREHLVKRVFPKLREWCEPRKLRLVECDLRWGIPKDSTTAATIQTCFSEIDRCKEENECPYFINLLSERYGWVPAINEVPEDIRLRYNWLAGMSITGMEIQHGAYRENNPNAIFFFRHPSFLHDMQDSNIRTMFVDENDHSKKSISEMKKMIRDAFPDRTKEYKCKMEGVGDDGKVRLDGLTDFGEQVLDHFKDALARQYPSDKIHDAEDTTEVMKAEHEIFMASRSQVLLGRDDQVTAITNYIETSTSDVPLVLIGNPGAGKSAIVAFMAQKYVQMSMYKVFYHFVGATPGSTNLHRLLSRIWVELMPRSEPVPVDLDELIRSMTNVYSKASSGQKVVLFIDAVNQMDNDESFKMRWLPDELNNNIRVVVSTLDGPFLYTLRSRDKKPIEVAVDPLPAGIRGEIVAKILAEYNKKLDREQMVKLVGKQESGNPLWLSTACEELRLYGDFDRLTSKIESLADDLPGILQQMIERVADENGGDLVRATLCLLECSKHGLLENELLELLAIKPVVPETTDAAYEKCDVVPGEKVPMAEWALVYIGLKRFLRPCGSSGEGRLDFYHRSISKAVRNVYMDGGSQERKKWWHTRLADYFQQSSDIERRAEELPYHLDTIDDMSRLQECLLEWPMFEAMYKEETKIELMRYWRLVGGYDVAAKLYGEKIKQEMSKVVHNESAEERKGRENVNVKINKLVSRFLSDIGQYDAAREKLGEAIQFHLDEYGEDDTESLFTLVKLCYDEAIKFVYGSHPGYRKCCRLGAEYAGKCLEAYKKQDVADDDESLGQFYLYCGYFLSETYYEKAKAIYTQTGDKRGLAQTLYMHAEKFQYDSSFNKSKDMYEEALKLCLSEFGEYHQCTARCNQLYGQLYWNRWSQQMDPDWATYMVPCLGLYEKELNILETLLGPLHPTVVRSREDVIIILQTLGRNDEADKLQEEQPDHSKTIVS